MKSTDNIFFEIFIFLIIIILSNSYFISAEQLVNAGKADAKVPITGALISSLSISLPPSAYNQIIEKYRKSDGTVDYKNKDFVAAIKSIPSAKLVTTLEVTPSQTKFGVPGVSFLQISVAQEMYNRNAKAIQQAKLSHDPEAKAFLKFFKKQADTIQKGDQIETLKGDGSSIIKVKDSSGNVKAEFEVKNPDLQGALTGVLLADNGLANQMFSKAKPLQPSENQEIPVKTKEPQPKANKDSSFIPSPLKLSSLFSGFDPDFPYFI